MCKKRQSVDKTLFRLTFLIPEAEAMEIVSLLGEGRHVVEGEYKTSREGDRVFVEQAGPIIFFGKRFSFSRATGSR